MWDFLRLVIIHAIVLLAKLLLNRGIILSRYYDAFGHQAWNLEHYSRRYMKEYGKFPRIIAFQRSDFVPNKALYKRHKKQGVYIVSPNSVLTRLYRMARNGYITMSVTKSNPEHPSQSLLFCRYSMNDVHVDQYVNQDAGVAFPFSDLEKKQAEAILSKYGLKPFQYVCFQDRNIEYKRKIPEARSAKTENCQTVTSDNSDGNLSSVMDSNKKWYERFKENNIDLARNTSLSYLYDSVKYLDEENLKSVRIGADPTKPSDFPLLFDYASIRTSADEFTDLVLMNYCKFFVGPNTGLWALARAYNRPVCLINAFPWPWINVPMHRNSVVVPKKCWHTVENRYLSIIEMIQMESNFDWKNFYRDEFFNEMHINVVENSPTEILFATKELNNRIDNKWSGASYPVSEVLQNSNIANKSESYLSSYFVETSDFSTP